MADFNETPKVEENEELSEESTVFSAPKEHRDKDLKSPKKRRITAVISAVLAVLILVGGTLAIIKFIPKLEDEENTSSTEDNTITVIDYDSAKFNTVTVKNSNGEFVLYPEIIESDDDSSEPQINWYVKNIAKDKISADKTGEIVSAAAKVTATMEITKKTFDECGLNKPVAKITVNSKGLGNFTLTVGGTSPDNTGVYLYSSLDEKIYLVSQDVLIAFTFTELDLAGTGEVPAVSVKTKSENYFDGNGNLAAFDKLEISGGRYEDKIVIAPISEEEGETVAFAYKVISPEERYAESEPVTNLFAPFSTGISVSGVYSLETDNKTLARFGLDKPDVVLTLTVAKQTFTYKFALQKDGYYALCGDGISTVKKVSESAASFLNVKATDIYNKLAYIRSISEIKNMSFKLKDKSYNFSIKENGEDDEEKFTVYYGKKLIKSENFQNFYMHFVSLSLADFSYKPGGETALSVVITDNGGKTETLTFNKASATEYYCSLSGKPLGKITASAYNKLISDLDTVSQNKDVEEK